MGVKEVLQKLSGKGSQSRQMINGMADQLRMERIAHERQLSPNERELNQLRNEEREGMVKEELDYRRKKRQRDIDFGHQPLDAKNIMKAEWEVLKEKNQFSKKSDTLTNQSSVLNSNKNLLKSSNKLMKGGNVFKI